ncbi:PEP-CTERM sorting domain-containing protein [Denitrobaculum tricleocarpae]|uniref:PEP-CTERM sorting domain-containing protein n=1 Tax=Denitrobaculum tricleocarpae TaxID=2591009 RepID=UPI001FE33097|nr:PEP-CTERM sorting domain-containing protein [Denitrobaculum tricleocarpae]
MFRTLGASLRGSGCGSRTLAGGQRRGNHRAAGIKTGLALGLTLALGVFTLGQTAQATPIQLDAAQFTAQTQGLTVTTEDFTGVSGEKPNPYSFTNGTFTGRTPIVVGSGRSCPNSFWCLADAGRPQETKTISALPAGTQFWAAELSMESRTDNPFDITVTGGSGTLEITGLVMDKLNFLGFFDPLGILSVSFLNKGTQVGNSRRYSFYSFDNIRTAGGLAVDPVAVSEPGTLALLGLGLLGLGMLRRRKAA